MIISPIFLITTLNKLVDNLTFLINFNKLVNKLSIDARSRGFGYDGKIVNKSFHLPWNML